MAPPRRKGPVGQFVATMGAPTEREVEMYVVDMEADQLARLKVAPTMPEKEVSVGDMEQIKLVNSAAKKGVPTIPKKGVFVLSMAQSINVAAKKGAPPMPEKEESAYGMGQFALPKRAAMMDAPTKLSKEVSAEGMEAS